MSNPRVQDPVTGVRPTDVVDQGDTSLTPAYMHNNPVKPDGTPNAGLPMFSVAETRTDTGSRHEGDVGRLTQ